MNAIVKPEPYSRWVSRTEDFYVDVLHVTQDDQVIYMSKEGVAWDAPIEDFHRQFEPDTSKPKFWVPRMEKCWDCSGTGERAMSYGIGYQDCMTCRGSGHLHPAPRMSYPEPEPKDVYSEVAEEVERQDLSTPKWLAWGAWSLYWIMLGGTATWLAIPFLTDVWAWISAALR